MIDIIITLENSNIILVCNFKGLLKFKEEQILVLNSFIRLTFVFKMILLEYVKMRFISNFTRGASVSVLCISG